MYIKSKDKVRVISGKDKQKEGIVLSVSSIRNKVLVSNVNMVKKHLKNSSSSSEGIIAKESFINVSNIMLLCDKCGKTTRPKFDFLSDGRKVRTCKKCSEIII